MTDKKENLKKLADLEVALQRIIEEVSISQLTKYSGLKDLDLEYLPADHDFSNDHWICMMLIVCPGISISIRCHFSSKAARQLATRVLGSNPSSVELCHSFIGEYCNLVGGGVKNAFASAISSHFANVGHLESTIPTKSPSFDLGNPPSNSSSKKQIWQIKWTGEQIVFSSAIDLDEKKISSSYQGQLDKLIEGISSFKILDSGEVEWF